MSIFSEHGIQPDVERSWRQLFSSASLSDREMLTEIVAWTRVLKRSIVDLTPWADLLGVIDRDIIDAWLAEGLSCDDYRQWGAFGVGEPVLVRCLVDEGHAPHKVLTTPTAFPTRMISWFGKEWPEIWAELDRHRHLGESSEDRMSLAALEVRARTIRAPLDAMLKALPEGEAIQYSLRARIYSQWRLSQGIYRFHPAVYEALLESELSGEIPAEAFRYLPESSLWIETPALQTSRDPIIGFFVRIYEKADELWLQAIAHRHASIRTFSVPLVNMTVEELSIHDTDGSPLVEIRVLLKLLLFLSQPDPDIVGTPREVLPTKTKRGLRYFPPPKPQVWDVGVRIGPRLEEANALALDSPSGGSRAVRPHIRRGHWRRIPYGRRSEPKVIRPKWIHSLLVREDLVEFAGLPAVVRQVGEAPSSNAFEKPTR